MTNIEPIDVDQMDQDQMDIDIQDGLNSIMNGDVNIEEFFRAIRGDNNLEISEDSIEVFLNLLTQLSQLEPEPEPKKIMTNIYMDPKTDDCAICLEKLMGTSNSIIILTCGHMFHNECFRGHTCCMCRSKVQGPEVEW